ncbi:MAG: hypothetical protein WBN66_11955 [Smithella sp.]
MKKSFDAKTLIYPTPLWLIGTYESMLGEDGLPDIMKINPIIYAPENRAYHGVGQYLGTAFRLARM